MDSLRCEVIFVIIELLILTAAENITLRFVDGNVGSIVCVVLFSSLIMLWAFKGHQVHVKLRKTN